jgi:hypothetical protein
MHASHAALESNVERRQPLVSRSHEKHDYGDGRYAADGARFAIGTMAP